MSFDATTINLKTLTAMKKKALLLAGLSAFGLYTWEAQAATTGANSSINYEKKDTPDGIERIELHGDLMRGINPNAIEAEVTDNAVYIHFNESFGNVSITIYNSDNLVFYSTVVDTAIQQVVIIPITTATADTYTVVLDNANGYAEGEFDHD